MFINGQALLSRWCDYYCAIYRKKQRALTFWEKLSIIIYKVATKQECSRWKQVERILKYYNRIIDNLSNQELIRTSELNGLSIYSKEISELVESGYIERVKQGYYRIVEHTEDHSEAKLISQLYPDGIICMVSALFYYGYSDRTPINWDIAIDRNVSKARFNIDYPYVKPY